MPDSDTYRKLKFLAAGSLSLIGATLSILSFPGCSSENGETIKLPLEGALSDFTVFRSEVTGRDRTIGTVYIHSESFDFDERARTSLLAAVAFQKKKAIDYVKVHHLAMPHQVLIGKGEYIATAEFALDGRGADGSTPLRNGPWQASAFMGQRNDIEALIAVFWHQIQHESSGSLTDEQLRHEISKRLDGQIVPEEVKLPTYTLVAYNPPGA